VTFNNAFQNC